MSYAPISIDLKALTIMGVPFPSLDAWECAAAAIGSNMFEGYEPTRRGIEIIRDYTTGKRLFGRQWIKRMRKSIKRSSQKQGLLQPLPALDEIG